MDSPSRAGSYLSLARLAQESRFRPRELEPTALRIPDPYAICHMPYVLHNDWRVWILAVAKL